jgi:hypothetical protein
MASIVFLRLPGVAAVERQLGLHARGHLDDHEVEELPHLLDDTSRALFGITLTVTFYAALPPPVTARFSRAEWEANFDPLAGHGRDPNVHWRQFDLDLRCEKGSSLHCLEVFGRQLIVALNGLHPKAILAFAEQSKAA